MPYVRPPIPRQVFTAADGTSYEYGGRWSDRPPEATYSHDSHPERFAPLHDVADALVAHLLERYEVTRDDSAPFTLSCVGPAVRAVRLTPTMPDAAPLTLAWLRYPGIGVKAGAAYESVFPICGCDACDEPVESEADGLERLVLGVADGLFAESVTHDGITWSLTQPDGWAGGGSTPADVTESARVRRLLPAAGEAWRPWPARRRTRTAEF
ncbi:DUF6226 family protein [Cellulomonas soli]|uniref:Uncharacterized protein n=1 Tax=Cellulomonas soli TaxID=931535 RepID=A0A512PHL2_9CELL|nr:DUF6226 family protein [Cellulomonas soli]NYI59175.1 hypothetical protein [Cellulomonas soli]GEP70680.1 hypothetical protein CSO01_33950 [Cellulomonas soli]